MKLWGRKVSASWRLYPTRAFWHSMRLAWCQMRDEQDRGASLRDSVLAANDDHQRRMQQHEQ